MRIRDALRSSRVRLGVLLVGLLFVAGGAGTTDTELKLGPYTAKLGADGKLDPNWRGVPRGAPPHVPDLCLSADEVLVALVGTSEATWETWPVVNGNAIVTTATVTSLATIRSEVGHDRALTLRMYGGTLPSGLSMTAGGPVLRTGETYLLFLGTNTRYESPEILGWRLLPEGVAPALPPGSVLGQVWEATCLAHPEGVYFHGPPVKVVVPWTAWVWFNQADLRALDSAFGSAGRANARR